MEEKKEPEIISIPLYLSMQDLVNDLDEVAIVSYNAKLDFYFISFDPFGKPPSKKTVSGLKDRLMKIGYDTVEVIEDHTVCYDRDKVVCARQAKKGTIHNEFIKDTIDPVKLQKLEAGELNTIGW